MKFETPNTYRGDVMFAGRCVMTLVLLVGLPLSLIAGTFAGACRGFVAGFEFTYHFIKATWEVKRPD